MTGFDWTGLAEITAGGIGVWFVWRCTRRVRNAEQRIAGMVAEVRRRLGIEE